MKMNEFQLEEVTEFDDLLESHIVEDRIHAEVSQAFLSGTPILGVA